MQEIRYPSLGATWLAALREVYRSGQTVSDETREVLRLCVAFENGNFQADPLLLRFASRRHVEEMRKVFFSREPNLFGHNYSDRLHGPQGRDDLSDVIELLRREPATKRAVVTLVGSGYGRVPCINVLHFLLRNDGLITAYFARGQDIFRKFYADGVCLFELAERVAADLHVPLRLVSGVISSAHIYLEDLAEIRRVLAEADRPGEASLCRELA